MHSAHTNGGGSLSAERNGVKGCGSALGGRSNSSNSNKYSKYCKPKRNPLTGI
jgi:hypothetical protein